VPRTIAMIGLVILLIGAIIGFVGAVSPVSAVAQKPVTIYNNVLTIDPNDYQSHSVVLTKGQTINVTFYLDNQTIFFVYIMNQSQYYVFYNCAPTCHQPLLGGNGTFWQQANESEPALVNMSVSPSSPFKYTFTAPANETYYIVLDNSIGPKWIDYLYSNGTSATGTLVITGFTKVTEQSTNWPLVVPGVIILLVGGVISTITWEGKKSEQQKKS